MRSPKQESMLKKTISILVSNLLTRVLTAITLLFLVRALDAAEYGYFSLAIALSVLLSFFTDLGTAGTFTREANNENTDLKLLLSSFFWSRLFLACLIAMISFLVIRLSVTDHVNQTILIAMIIPYLFGNTLFSVSTVYYQAAHRMSKLALLRIIFACIFTLLLFIGIISKLSVIGLSLLYGGAYVTTGIIALLFLLNKIGLPRRGHTKLTYRLLSFAIGTALVMISPQLGPVILNLVSSIEEVGVFSASLRFPAILYQFPGVLATIFYPILFQQVNRNQFALHFNTSLSQIKWMCLLGMLVSLPIVVYPDWFIAILFGDKWLIAAAPVSILSGLVILQAINIPLADALTTLGKQKHRNYVVAISLLFAVLLYSVLGFKFGAIGGAAASVTVEFIMLIGFVIAHPHGLRLVSDGVRRSLFCYSAVLSAGLLLLKPIHPILGISLLLLAFLSLLYSFDRQVRKALSRATITSFIRGN